MSCFSLDVYKAACRSDEKRHHPNTFCVQPNIIHMEDVETFWSAILITKASCPEQENLMLHHQPRSPDISVIRLEPHFCKEIRAYLVFHDIHNVGCNNFSM